MDELLTKCYAVLGLQGNASKQEVTQAYESLKQSYSGIQPGTDEKTGPPHWEQLKELNWAYDTLLNLIPEEEKQPPQKKQEAESILKTPPPREKIVSTPSDFVIRTDLGRARVIAKTISWLFLAFIITVSGYFLWHTKGGQRPQPQKTTTRAPADPAEVLQYAKKAVITVTFEEKISGSAFLVSPNGYMVTNAHVVKNRIGKAQFSTGENEEVELVLMDPEKDFALLKASSKNDYPYLKLGDSNLCREGDSLIAIGSPFTLQSTFTKGIVSAKDRHLPGRAVSFIQTDAAVNPGNSGGPLINANGEVVGINTWVVNKGMAEGLNFAVSINDVKSLIARGQTLSEEERRNETADVESKWRRTIAQYNHGDSQGEDTSREQRLRDNLKKLEESRQQSIERVEQERRRTYDMGQQKRQDLQRCLNRARADYETDWEAECGRWRSPGGCKLPSKAAAILDRKYRDDQEDCYRRYNQHT
jgi:S1-C subfamily serine protease